MSTQHTATLLDATCRVRLATVLRCIGTYWVLLVQVWKWSNLAKRKQHVASNNVAICCFDMFKVRSFGRGFRSLQGLYFPEQPKRASVPTKELASFWTTWMRSVIENVSPVFHNWLLSYLSDEPERFRRCDARTVSPHVIYCEAIGQDRLDTFYDRRRTVRFHHNWISETAASALAKSTYHRQTSNTTTFWQQAGTKWREMRRVNLHVLISV